MLIITFNKKIRGKIKEYMKLSQIAFTTNGEAFEIDTDELHFFNLGRYYQQELTNYYNELSFQEKEEARKNTTRLRP